MSRGENGLLVPPRNPEALAEAIGILIENVGVRLRMEARGREIVTQKFSEERVVRETLAICPELLAAKWPSLPCSAIGCAEAD